MISFFFYQNSSQPGTIIIQQQGAVPMSNQPPSYEPVEPIKY